MTPSEILVKRLELTEIFVHLEQASEQLAAAVLKSSDFPIWIWKGNNRKESQRLAVKAILSLDYLDNQQHWNTFLCPGIIGLHPAACSLVNEINQYRQQLKSLLANMDQVDSKGLPVHRSNAADSLSKYALKALGRARLNRKQATRQIVLLPATPDRVSFVWTSDRKIKRTNKQQVLDKLNAIAMDTNSDMNSRVQFDIANIQALPESEPLAIIDPPHVHPKANVVMNVAGKLARKKMRATMPFVYPAQSQDSTPEIVPLTLEPSIKKRKKRSDCLWSDEAFLSTLRIHRLLDPTINL